MELKADPHCCEEEAAASLDFYIPCNKPALAMIKWKHRADAPIRVCAQCEEHNLKRRGGERVSDYSPEAALAKQIPACYSEGI